MDAILQQEQTLFTCIIFKLICNEQNVYIFKCYLPSYSQGEFAVLDLQYLSEPDHFLYSRGLRNKESQLSFLT